MTKRELIEAVINARSSIPRREAEALVNSVFASLAEALARGERIEIRGFGSFIVKRRNAREGLNPKTGEVVSVMAKRVPFFKAGKELKQRVDRQPPTFPDVPSVSAATPAAAATSTSAPASASGSASASASATATVSASAAAQSEG